MTIEHKNEALLRRWFEEIWNQKCPERIAELAAPDMVAHGMGPNGTDLHGPAAFEQVYALFMGAFPDLHVTVEQSVASGDMVVFLLRCEATHQGGQLGVPASGKRVAFPVMTTARYREGKIIEGWNVLDLLAALRQAEATPLGQTLP